MRKRIIHLCIDLAIRIRIIEAMNTQDILQRLSDLGWSQQAIAEETKIPQPRLSRWKNGKGSDSADDALKLQGLLHTVEVGQAEGG